ncbi:MAG: type II toxin-antitoxin system prevent-host-death family antitoxin [Gemmatimonadota bacterium]
MPDEYSIYDAKAKLSALVRQVREGRSFVITVHGEPVAELRPIEVAVEGNSLERRLKEMTASGQITPARRSPSDPKAFPVGKAVPGALQRFLDDRD